MLCVLFFCIGRGTLVKLAFFAHETFFRSGFVEMLQRRSRFRPPPSLHGSLRSRLPSALGKALAQGCIGNATAEGHSKLLRANGGTFGAPMREQGAVLGRGVGEKIEFFAQTRRRRIFQGC